VLHQSFELSVKEGVIGVVFFGVRSVLVFEHARFFIDIHDHLIEAVERVVLSVADEGPFLFFGDEADVLADVPLCLSFGEVLAVIVVGWCWEGVLPAFLAEPGDGVRREGFPFDGELRELLFHTLSLLAISRTRDDRDRGGCMICITHIEEVGMIRMQYNDDSEIVQINKSDPPGQDLLLLLQRGEGHIWTHPGAR
jgi:hypothetical protein